MRKMYNDFSFGVIGLIGVEAKITNKTKDPANVEINNFIGKLISQEHDDPSVNKR